MTRSRFAKPGRIALIVLVVTTLYQWACAATSTDAADGTLFSKACANAMTRMMSQMSVPGSDNVDQDFVARMIPHHQGAVEMAEAEIRFGKNERLRRLAQEIIIEQQQQIRAMRVALEQTK